MKIFYSWQMDLPTAENKHFIQNCLEAAVKALNESPDIESADRNEESEEADSEEASQSSTKTSAVELDHDTKGILGIPAIADTILAKIEKCDVFVADVSFTGKGVHNKKFLPNSNVMLELGYAMGKLGDQSVILLMNTAYGDWKKLPFDLQHRRRPVTYSSKKDQKTEAEALTKTLKEILEEYLQSGNAISLEVELRATGPFSGDVYRFDVLLTNKTDKVFDGYFVEVTLPGIGSTDGQNEYWQEDKDGIKFRFQPHNHPSIVPGGKDFNFRNSKRVQIAPFGTDKIGHIVCNVSKARDDRTIRISSSAPQMRPSVQVTDLDAILKAAQPKDA